MVVGCLWFAGADTFFRLALIHNGCLKCIPFTISSTFFNTISGFLAKITVLTFNIRLRNMQYLFQLEHNFKRNSRKHRRRRRREKKRESWSKLSLSDLKWPNKSEYHMAKHTRTPFIVTSHFEFNSKSDIRIQFQSTA